jgi:hypothetical protein
LHIFTRFDKSLVDSRKHHEILVTIIEATDTLLENYYSTEVAEREDQAEISKIIPCPHCLQSRLHNDREDDLYLFDYYSCVTAVTSGETTMICKKSNEMIPLSLLAPDIALSGIKVIGPDDLIIDKELGKGGKRKDYDLQ